MTGTTHTERGMRKSPAPHANRVVKSSNPYQTPRPDYATPEGAVTYTRSLARTDGGELKQSISFPVSLPRVAWLERPEVCPEIKGLV